MDDFSQNLAGDRMLEVQIFQRLEQQAHIRLCELVRLRRLSRNQHILLLDAAYLEGRLNRELAIEIARDLALEWIPPGPLTSTLGAEYDQSASMLDESDSMLDGVPDLIAAPPALQLPPKITSQPQPISADSIPVASETQPGYGSILADAAPVDSLASGDSPIDQLRAKAVANANAMFEMYATAKPVVDSPAFGRTLGSAMHAFAVLSASCKLSREDRRVMRKLLEIGREQAHRLNQDIWVHFFGTFLGEDETWQASDTVKAVAKLRIRIQQTTGPVDLNLLDVKKGLVNSTPFRSFDHSAGFELPLRPGQYQLKLSVDAGVYSVPIAFDGTKDKTIHIRRPKSSVDLVGYALIYEGNSTFGGDPLAWQSRPAEDHYLSSFLIGRSPISCAEYQVFLNQLAQSHGIDHAALSVPRSEADQPYWPCINGGFQIPENDTEGIRWAPSLPVVGITQADAETYCRWLDARFNERHRLPTELEWEKAARGPNGYAFPWGDRWDSKFCHSRKATIAAATRNPGIDFIYDQSVYGVAEMAGRVSEWTSTTDGDSAIIKGGHWLSGAIECRAASRFTAQSAIPTPHIGFRVVREISENDFEDMDTQP
ncbi:MAG: SUMF1/EgtB/PvdO family nonheme iron enzyme [Myxococcota bacterium]|nr:SUMF1/EgtB/PvdO family nonheme iron enzyme [Myxococcota bacterium]